MKTNILKLFIILIAALTVLSSCASNGNGSVTSSVTTAVTTEPPVTSTEPPVTEPPIVEPEESRVSLVAVGDNLIHGYLITAGQTFGFDTFYERIEHVVSEADLAIINQESVLTYNTSIYSGYPNFASPTDVVDAAIRAGFDIFTLATNHTWDRGLQPIRDTIDHFSKYPEVTTLGVNATEEDCNTVKIIEKNGIRIAFFNYTYGFNRSAQVGWMVERLTNKTRMKEQLAYARENSDFIIVIPHWGQEYKFTPNSTQVSWAKFFADEGVDLIIGHHPHVVQPMDEITGKNGNKTVVYYSLGNIISNQNDFIANIGAMASVTIVKDENGTRIESNELIPTTVLPVKVNGVRKYSALFLSDLTPELLKTNFKFASSKTVNDFWDKFTVAAGSYPK